MQYNFKIYWLRMILQEIIQWGINNVEQAYLNGVFSYEKLKNTKFHLEVKKIGAFF